MVRWGRSWVSCVAKCANFVPIAWEGLKIHLVVLSCLAWPFSLSVLLHVVNAQDSIQSQASVLAGSPGMKAHPPRPGRRGGTTWLKNNTLRTWGMDAPRLLPRSLPSRRADAPQNTYRSSYFFLLRPSRQQNHLKSRVPFVGCADTSRSKRDRVNGLWLVRDAPLASASASSSSWAA
jgi:hypothetical protein